MIIHESTQTSDLMDTETHTLLPPVTTNPSPGRIAPTDELNETLQMNICI